MSTKEDCRLCQVTRTVGEMDVVKTAYETRQLSIETMMTAVRDAVVLGWVLRDVQGEPDQSKQFITDHLPICDDHRAQVAMLTEDKEPTAEPTSP